MMFRQLPRAVWVATALHTALTGVLMVTPLFNLLAYEFALAHGLLAGITAPWLGSAAGLRVRGLLALPCGWMWASTQLLPGLLLISLNAVRVQNCDWWEGLAFFAIIPWMSALYGASLGSAVALLWPDDSRRRRWALVALVAGAMVWTLHRLYTEPSIVAYDHLFGHFAGSLYDEQIFLDSRLGWFRVGTALRIALLGGVVWAWQSHRFSKRPLLTASVASLVALALFETNVGPSKGFRVSRGDIRAVLSDRVELPGLVVHLPPGLNDDLRQSLIDDHRFRFYQVSKQLNVEVVKPIHSYVYRDAAQKMRLMGARGTNIAKPWQREIHIHNLEAPHPVLAHELVHALAADFGSRLLGVSAKYELFVNMGLVEGLAEALTPARHDLDVDTLTRAMHQAKRAPDMERLVGPLGFWSAAPRRAYTVAGSFLRFLAREHGGDAVKRCYPTGDFESAFGKPLPELISGWQRYLEDVEVKPSDMAMASRSFWRGSIFSLPCAHEVAQLRARARSLSGDAAVQAYRRIHELVPTNKRAELDWLRAALRTKGAAAHLDQAEALAASDAFSPDQRTTLWQSIGMVAWHAGSIDRAKAAFDAADAIGVSPVAARTQWVRRWAFGLDPPRRDVVRRFLSGTLPPVAAVARLSAWHAEAPDPTLAYLVARQLHHHGDLAGATALLDLPHPSPEIDAERIRLLASAAWQQGFLDAAAEAYTTYRDLAPTSGERERAADWLERIEWRRRSP